MQVPAYVSLGVIVGCYLQPGLPRRTTTHTMESLASGSPQVTSQAGLEVQVTSPFAGQGHHVASFHLPTQEQSEAGLARGMMPNG